VAFRLPKTAYWIPTLAAGAAVYAADELAIPLALGYGAYRASKRAYSMAAEAWSGARAMSRSRSNSAVRRPGRSYGRSTTTRRPVRFRPRASKPHSTGHYQGKLKAPRRAKRPGKYAKHGFTAEVERYGTQGIGEVCYVGASSYCKADLGPVIGIALLRKLMKKHYQFEYTHKDSAILSRILTSFAQGAGPYAINFFYEQESGTATGNPTINLGATFTIHDHATATTKTLVDFGAWFNTNVLQNPDFGGTDHYTDRSRIHGYQFIEGDYTIQAGDPGGAPMGRRGVVQPLAGQYLTAYSYVTFGIQNATPADDGSLLTTHITSNPIKGKLMRFRDMLPRLKQLQGIERLTTDENAYKLCLDVNADGIIKPVAAITGDWVQIPTAAMFDNCSGELSVQLEPGAIKDYTFGFKFNGTLQKFINGNRHNPNTALPLPFATTGLFGTSCLFMLEKRMPTGSAAPTLNFHYEAKFGCVFGRKSVAVMQRAAAAQAVVTTA